MVKGKYKFFDEAIKTYAFDLDGTLTIHEPFLDFITDDVFNACKPNNIVIKKLQQIKAQGHKIVIYTSRPDVFLDITKLWLQRHQVPFDHLVMNKFWADVYIDDRAIRPEEL